jgi:DNA-binding NarL/FixJ family response regulator
MTHPPPAGGAPRAGTRALRLHLGDAEFALLSVPILPPALAAALTAAERAVVCAAVEGLSNAAIARRRHSSPRTVAAQLASAFRKLGIGSRAELASRCAGYGPDPS